MKIKSIYGKCWYHSFTSYPLSKQALLPRKMVDEDTPNPPRSQRLHGRLHYWRQTSNKFIATWRARDHMEGFGGVLTEQRRPKRNSSQGIAEGHGRGEETFPLTFCKMICIVLVTKRKCLPGEAVGFRVEAGCRKEQKMWVRAFWAPASCGAHAGQVFT